MSDLIQAGQHPDADQLNAFVEHVLPPHEQQQTMAHLAGCPSCRQVVALSLPPEDERQTEVVRRPWFSRWHPAWAGIPALAAVILVGFFVSKRERAVPQLPAPGPMAEARPPAPPPAEAAPSEPTPPAAPQRQRLNQNRAVAAAKQPPPVGQQQEPAVVSGGGAGVGGGVPGGVMGGVLGGIGAGPPQPSTHAHSFAPASGNFGGPTTSLAVDQLQSVSGPSPLPSGLAIISMASRAGKRLAIDTQHHLFCSDDEGRSWKAVASPWKGRAVAVALTSDVSNGRHVPPFLQVSSRPAGNAGVASGSLAGAIKDPSGAVIPGATVVATRSGGTSARSATTDSQGRFRIEYLVPGSYQIEAQAPGFLKQSFAAEVAPSQQAVADVALHVGSAAQSVMIQTASPPVSNALAATKAAPSQTLSPFVLTTSDGEHWTSTDGQSWTRQ